jgi:hypothetical protein
VCVFMYTSMYVCMYVYDLTLENHKLRPF